MKKFRKIKYLSLSLALILVLGLVISCGPGKKPLDPDLTQGEDLGLERDNLRQEIDQMSLEEKIGQLMILGFEEDYLSSSLKTRLEDLQPGGLILFQRNIKDSRKSLELLSSIKAYNKSLDNLPIFISSDEEGGQVSRLPSDIDKNPPASQIGKLSDLGLVRDLANHSALVLSDLGINMNNAPVLDIRYNPNNEITKTRTYGNTPERVADYGMISIEEYKARDILAVAKHFPGHGSTDVDSHVSLPVVTKSQEDLLREDIYPFKQAIDGGVDGLMISHILYRDLDSKPATLSKKIIQDLLIDRLGYKNLIISDDMTMGAITNSYEPEKAAVEFIKAGGHIVLLCHGDSIGYEFREEVKKQLEKGQLSQEDLDERVYKILKMKQLYKIKDEENPASNQALDIDGLNRQLKSIMEDKNIQREDQEILGR